MLFIAFGTGLQAVSYRLISKKSIPSFSFLSKYQKGNSGISVFSQKVESLRISSLNHWLSSSKPDE